MSEQAMPALLIVDDDDEIRKRAAQYFQDHGYDVTAAASGEEALAAAREKVFHVAVLDISMPGMSGVELLKELKKVSPETEAVMLTGQGSIENAVEAMKLGARDFLTKPVRFQHLAVVIEKAAEAERLRKENRHLRAAIERTQVAAGMIGKSPAMHEVYRLIERVGPTDKPVLIQGESGTGKELVARALHRVSPLAKKPLVVINCAALPETLLESELFGHEKGSFTGAVSLKEGLFEVADGGTLFIDEIGELSPALQPKLLRVLEDGWMRRIGSVKDRRVNVRLLSATNRDLAKEVEAKRFREDLFYRLNVLAIPLPPLRERGNDILLLADEFAGSDWQWQPEARAALRAYRWPGNVRQLMNAVERAKILADGKMIRWENLPPEVTSKRNDRDALATHETADLDTDLAAMKRSQVVRVLSRERGNKQRAAKQLGITRRSLYRLLEKFNISDEEYAN
jgi:DNA-binding NtrC family response regulator